MEVHINENMNSERSHRAEPDFLMALMAGSAAGLAVDITLFPLDTIKTRLQSAQGFWKAGGFRGIYSGLASAATGSAPNAAAFFCTYEMVKQLGRGWVPMSFEPVIHMGAASCGEVVACLVRVPVEVVKQRAQTRPELNSWSVLKRTLKTEGIFGLYRGYLSTVIREIPFSLIQFPLWEVFKKVWSAHRGQYVDSWQSSVCGAIAGCISSGITTPLDVAKTRIMLAEKGSSTSKGHILPVLRDVWREKGLRGLFAGAVPRIMWISVGGAIFFGVYEETKSIWAYYYQRILG
ncbi:S-adenosylmethionine mitochondrial carrier protein-like isoform X2 [Limulus polyphemus]|uniref:S-adenosylmethionine mitochondrial carrier protein-like isoform X2 n=1 Tax=Limulus polyphemus TaxID=6850 RepID=A0ABM1BMX3_LIMPO|nr:S-adenosylmethionine mitochondrial carrier protein-like isoform X2 [Limulus polyphemus]